MEIEKVNAAFASIEKTKKHLARLESFVLEVMDEVARERSEPSVGTGGDAPEWISDVQEEMIRRLVHPSRRYRSVENGTVWVPFSPSAAAQWKTFRDALIPARQAQRLLLYPHPRIRWDHRADPTRPERECLWCGIVLEGI